MTAIGVHGPIVNQYRSCHSMCGCCLPATQAADCGKSVKANGVSDMVVLKQGPLRKMLTSELFAKRREAATGLRDGYGRAQCLETVRVA